MAKLYCPIQFQHQADDFWAIYKASVCAVERRRAQFFALRAEGRSEDEVMEITKYGVTTARLMIGRYHELRLAGLQDGRAQNRGRPRVLTADEQQALAARLKEDFAQGTVWTGQAVQAWLLAEYGKDVHLARSYEFMRAAGFSPQKPRPRHVKGDEQAKENFKTKSWWSSFARPSCSTRVFPSGPWMNTGPC